MIPSFLGFEFGANAADQRIRIPAGKETNLLHLPVQCKVVRGNIRIRIHYANTDFATDILVY